MLVARFSGFDPNRDTGRATYVESIGGQGGKINDQTVPSQAGVPLRNWHTELVRRRERLRNLACAFDEETPALCRRHRDRRGRAWKKEAARRDRRRAGTPRTTSRACRARCA